MKKNGSSFDWYVTVPIVVLMILAILLFAYLLDLNGVNEWLKQPITALNTGEFIVIVMVLNILFRGGK